MDSKKWSNQAIVEWHIKTFPKATVGSQTAKLEEEIQEYFQNPCLEEIADVYICATALGGRFQLDGVQHLIEQSCFGFYPKKYVENAVENKMDVNESRSWKFANGLYHHEEK